LVNLSVKHFNSSAYYPQGNGQSESTNKNLVRIVTKIIEDKPRQWHTLLTYALWVDHTTTKESIGCTPFQLVYGQEAILTLGFIFPKVLYGINSMELTHIWLAQQNITDIQWGNIT
jgi:hypothetical protein